MNLDDLFHLPPSVMLAFALLLWPALSAGALIIVSLAGDLLRQSTRYPGAAWHKAG